MCLCLEILTGETDKPPELNLAQIVNFPTQIPDCDSHSPALLDLFISSDASICSTMAFSPLGNSLWEIHFIVLHSIFMLIDTIFINHLRDVPGNISISLVLWLLLVNFVEWLQVGTDVYIPHQ